MTTDVSDPARIGQLLFPYLWFDAELNLIGDGPANGWPTAVLTVLRACVRRALAEDRSSFQPFGLGPKWHIARVDAAPSTRLAVFVEQSGTAEPCW
jgi:hypothetical protein